MKLFISTFLLFLSFNLAFSNVKVYKTYKDYIDSNGVDYDSYHSYNSSLGYGKIVFLKGGEKEKVACKDIWGFTVNDKLFRIDNETSGENLKNSVACLVSQGDICYYENGIAHLELTKTGADKNTADSGFLIYFSKNLEEDLYPMPMGTSNAGQRLKKFKKENPQYFDLFECLKSLNTTAEKYFEDVRKCVMEFEK